MNVKTLTTKVASKFGRQILTTRKHTPAMLFVGGVVGVVGTVVLASRATLKLEELIEEARERAEKTNVFREEMPDDYSDRDRKRDLTLIYAQTAGKLIKLYAPALALGAISVTALTGSHVMLTRRNVSLTAAYAALDKAFREYRHRVVEEVGEDKELELRRTVKSSEIEVRGKGKETVTKVVPVGASPYAVLFSQDTNRNWSPEHMYNQMFLRGQQNYANDLLQARGFVFLNEVLDMLGFEHTSAGQLVGWVKGGADGYVDFGIFDGDIYTGMRFAAGDEKNIWLDFNVDGMIYELIDKI